MAETPQETFRRVRSHVWSETLRRSFRMFLPCRVLANLWRMLRTGSFIHPLARIDKNVRIGRHCLIGNARLDTLGGHGQIEVGDGTIVYTGCELWCHHQSTIRLGQHVLFTREAAAVTGTHVFANREATILSQGVASADIVIEDDCWIGFRAILCPGSRVGRGTVVGAGAVVTKELPPMVVAGGVPARVIRQR